MSLSRRALLLAASATPLAAHAAAPGGIVCPLASAPSVLIPGVSDALETRLIGSKIYSGLCRVDAQGHVQPDLAAGWDVSGDGLTYTFRLRPGLTWHDSGAVNSDDVVFSIDRFHRRLQPRSWLQRVVSVRAPDPHTAVITLATPFPAFPRQLDALSLPIVPRHVHDQPGFGIDPHQVTPIGTGPFRVAEWLRLVRFDWFAGERPAVSEIACPILPDLAARMAVLQQGGALLAGDAVELAAIPRLRQLPGLAVEGEPGRVMAGLRLNHAATPLGDPRVRLALACAIDRASLLRDVWFGLGQVATGPVLSWTRNRNRQVALPAYDPRAAAGHLNDAGLRPDESGIRLRLTQLVPPAPPWKDFASRLQLLLGQVGVQLTVEPVSEADFTSRVLERRLPTRGLRNGADGRRCGRSGCLWQ